MSGGSGKPGAGSRKHGRNRIKCQRYAVRHGVAGLRRKRGRRHASNAVIWPMAGGALVVAVGEMGHEG